MQNINLLTIGFHSERCINVVIKYIHVLANVIDTEILEFNNNSILYLLSSVLLDFMSSCYV